jgi:hypothetical protein
VVVLFSNFTSIFEALSSFSRLVVAEFERCPLRFLICFKTVDSGLLQDSWLLSFGGFQIRNGRREAGCAATPTRIQHLSRRMDIYIMRFCYTTIFARGGHGVLSSSFSSPLRRANSNALCQVSFRGWSLNDMLCRRSRFGYRKYFLLLWMKGSVFPSHGY